MSWSNWLEKPERDDRQEGVKPEAARGMPGSEWSLLGTEMPTVRGQESIAHSLRGKPGTMGHCNPTFKPLRAQMLLERKKS